MGHLHHLIFVHGPLFIMIFCIYFSALNLLFLGDTNRMIAEVGFTLNASGLCKKYISTLPFS